MQEKVLIAIHQSRMRFTQGWIDYCEREKVNYRLVNCYDNDIVEQLADCDALMWHHNHMSEKDPRFAKQLLYSLETSGKVVFPDFRTTWHFDDKLGQKYLLEAIRAPLVKSYAFYSKREAMEWVSGTTFPVVFKLRGGSASDHVRLVKTGKDAARLVRKAFGSGFGHYQGWENLKERIRRYRVGHSDRGEILAGVARLITPPRYTRYMGKDRGYIYFQEFIPGNTHDIRIKYVNGRCFGLRRGVRPGDFRASGSRLKDYDPGMIPEEAIRISFGVARRLRLQSAAFDFVMKDREPLITELSYGFDVDTGGLETGYWDEELIFHPGSFDPFGWMVEDVIGKIGQQRS